MSEEDRRSILDRSIDDLVQSMERYKAQSLSSFEQHQHLKKDEKHRKEFLGDPTDLMSNEHRRWRGYCHERSTDIQNVCETKCKKISMIECLRSLGSDLHHAWTLDGPSLLKEAQHHDHYQTLLLTQVYLPPVLASLKSFVDQIEVHSSIWFNSRSSRLLKHSNTQPIIQVCAPVLDRMFKTAVVEGSVEWDGDDDDDEPQQQWVLVADPDVFGVWWKKTLWKNSSQELYTTTTHEDAQYQMEKGSNAVLTPLDLFCIFPTSSCQSRPHHHHAFFDVGESVCWNDGISTRWIQGQVIQKTVVDQQYKVELRSKGQDSQVKLVPLDSPNLIYAPQDRHTRHTWGTILLTYVMAIDDMVQKWIGDDENRDLSREIWTAVDPMFQPVEHLISRYFRRVFHPLQGAPLKTLCTELKGVFHHITRVFARPALVRESILLRALLVVLLPEITSIFETFETQYTSSYYHSRPLCRELGLFIQMQREWKVCHQTLCPPTVVSKSKKNGINANANWIQSAWDQLDTLMDNWMSLWIQTLVTGVQTQWYRCIYPQMDNNVSKYDEQDWHTSDKAWFSHSRCSYGPQMTIFHLHRIQHWLLSSDGDADIDLNRRVCLREIGFNVLFPVLEIVVQKYISSIHPSRGKLPQYQIDVLYLVLGFVSFYHRNLNLGEIVTREEEVLVGSTKFWTSITRLFTAWVIQCGPLDQVLRALKQHVKASKNSLLTLEALNKVFPQLQCPITPHQTSLPTRHLYFLDWRKTRPSSEKSRMNFNYLVTTAIEVRNSRYKKSWLTPDATIVLCPVSGTKPCRISRFFRLQKC